MILFNRSLKKQVAVRTEALNKNTVKLQESKEYLQALLDSTGDGIIVTDADSGKNIDVNHRQTEQKKVPIQMQPVLKEAIKLSRSTIPADIHIIQDLQSDCSLVKADPTQIHQIAMNLITNADHAVEPELTLT